jgi:hypothetical protein
MAPRYALNDARHQHEGPFVQRPVLQRTGAGSHANTWSGAGGTLAARPASSRRGTGVFSQTADAFHARDSLAGRSGALSTSGAKCRGRSEGSRSVTIARPG